MGVCLVLAAGADTGLFFRCCFDGQCPDTHGAAGVVAASTYLALVKEEPVESVQVGPSAAFLVFSDGG